MVTHEYPNHCGKSYCLIDTLDSIPYFDINKDFRSKSNDGCLLSSQSSKRNVDTRRLPPKTSNLLLGSDVCRRLTTSANEQELQTCCTVAKSVFAFQTSLLEVEPRSIVCGDIHRQYSDLLRIFDKNGFPLDVNILFLGERQKY
ncbi:hypothetical protein GCK72_026150 [Caenorhabditis remanei]|uniref:Calcineurin-like phosphoesterase domain-containing protein n=1 Tax=Caenorhabditis remanei TaxID=31234 RepID=A0A6A5G4Q3_CAERE|nr:hypothetical protein GCK72_026150 [Caenorhabditis remanei]KAF1749682.1 hypothetical protein GCK72_026150 [Caenorhabditis remanei]